MGRPRTECGFPDAGGSHVSLDDVRNLQLRYSRVRPEKIELAVVYVDGRVKVFEVDRFLITGLLEHLEEQEM
jgi:hypothetical protein